MNFNKLNEINTTTKKIVSNNIENSVETIQYDSYMEKLVIKLREALNYEEADKILNNSVENSPSELQESGGVLYRHKDFSIQVLLSKYGKKYEQTLNILKNLNLKTVPIHIETINKDAEMYIISKIAGFGNGTLKQLWQIDKKQIPNSTKLDVYQDLKNLTKAGYIDNNIANSQNFWFCTDDNRIILPIWQNLRMIEHTESKKAIMEQYYNTLFK